VRNPIGAIPCSSSSSSSTSSYQYIECCDAPNREFYLSTDDPETYAYYTVPPRREMWETLKYCTGKPGSWQYTRSYPPTNSVIEDDYQACLESYVSSSSSSYEPNNYAFCCNRTTKTMTLYTDNLYIPSDELLVADNVQITYMPDNIACDEEQEDTLVEWTGEDPTTAEVYEAAVQCKPDTVGTIPTFIPGAPVPFDPFSPWTWYTVDNNPVPTPTYFCCNGSRRISGTLTSLAASRQCTGMMTTNNSLVCTARAASSSSAGGYCCLPNPYGSNGTCTASYSYTMCKNVPGSQYFSGTTASNFCNAARLQNCRAFASSVSSVNPTTALQYCCTADGTSLAVVPGSAVAASLCATSLTVRPTQCVSIGTGGRGDDTPLPLYCCSANGSALAVTSNPLTQTSCVRGTLSAIPPSSCTRSYAHSSVSSKVSVSSASSRGFAASSVSSLPTVVGTPAGTGGPAAVYLACDRRLGIVSQVVASSCQAYDPLLQRSQLQLFTLFNVPPYTNVRGGGNSCPDACLQLKTIAACCTSSGWVPADATLCSTNGHGLVGYDTQGNPDARFACRNGVVVPR
jgi:hypothetical protein